MPALTSTRVPLPGSPALAPTYMALATRNGVADVPAASVTNTNKFTPNKTFAWAMNGGSTTFYAHMPRVLSPGLKAQLVALGLGS